MDTVEFEQVRWVELIKERVIDLSKNYLYRNWQKCGSWPNPTNSKYVLVILKLHNIKIYLY